MKFWALALGMMLLFAGLAICADIDGKWTGKMAGGPGGDMEINYTFKADGAKLTGSTTGPDGTKNDITDGKIDGNKISFTVESAMGETQMVFNYKGVLNGDSLELTFEMAGMPPMEGAAPMKFTLKRVK